MREIIFAAALLIAGACIIIGVSILSTGAAWITTGAVLAFVTSFDEVVVALFLAGLEQRTIPREMFKNVREQTEPTILAISCLLVAMSIVFLVLMEWLRRRNLQLRGISA